MKLLIIGGGAGGMGAAARARRLDEKAEIIVFERSGYASYSNCGLPYKFSDAIDKFSKLISTSPKRLKEQYSLDVRVKHEVIGVNSKEKYITIRDNLNDEVFKESYDKLVVAAGASAVKPNIPGIEGDNVFTLKTPDDVSQAENFIQKHNPKNIVVVGGGFIGLEIAENFKKSGYQVTIVDAASSLLPKSVDKDMSAWVNKAILKNGINLLLGESIKSIQDNSITLSSGTSLDADMIFVTIGVKPELDIYKEASIKTGATGGIIVDNKQKTSDDNIYAVGDAAETKSFTGDPVRLSLAFPASRQAVVASNNIFGYKNHLGKDDVWKPSPIASTLSLFGTTIASVGQTELDLKSKDIKYFKTVNARPSHLGVIKGAGNVFLKVLYDENFKILGAQAVGPKSTEKRISYISLAMMSGTTYDKFIDFMVAYSPVVDTTYDVTTMGARIAIHQHDGTLQSIFPEEFDDYTSKGYSILDVREPREWERGTIDGAITISLSTIRNKLDQLDKNKKYIVHCKTGARSYNTCMLLKAHGFKNVVNLSGGYDYYTTYKKFTK